MAEHKPPQDHTPQNEGEGNRTAAREYNDAQRRFVESGKVDKTEREAEQALDTPEKRAMDRAEIVGKSHKRAEDPEITRKP